MLKELNNEKDTPYKFIYPELLEVKMTPFDEVQAMIILLKL